MPDETTEPAQPAPRRMTRQRWRDKFTYKPGDIEILPPAEIDRIAAERAAAKDKSDEPADP
jgi:hypothetical protein